MNNLYLGDLAKMWGAPMFGPGSVMEWFHACVDAGVFKRVTEGWEVHRENWPAARAILHGEM